MSVLVWALVCLGAGALGGLWFEWWSRQTSQAVELAMEKPVRGDPYLLRGWMEVEQLAPSSKDDPV